MRILFATTAGAGHFGPLVPFARAAVEAGHEVVVAAPAPFESAVRGAGFEFHGVGEADPAERMAMFGRMREASFDDANRIMLRDGFFGIYPRGAMRAMIELVERSRPAVIVHESLEAASLVAAERFDVPHAQVLTGLAPLHRLLRREVVGPLGALLEAAGAPPDRAYAAMNEPALTLTPPSLEEPEDLGSALAFRSQAPPRVDDGPARPLVFVTLGSEAAAQGLFPDFYRSLIGVLASTGAELVVALGQAADPEALGPLPPGVRAERWVDQPEVLRRAAATVFHGGYGTMIGSLAAGVPLVGMPLFSIDQKFNAERIAAVGAGLAIDGPQDLGSLPEAVGRVLAEPGFRNRAAEFADEIAGLPEPAEAVSQLEAIAR
jgi:UDP:flavonoid glycosyltransferase YjiC (YdhE family)